MFNKKIIIRNDKDLNRFYRRIKFYKLMYLTKFESTNEDIKYIVYALNIKNRKKRIEYVYDRACSIIDNYWNKINFCGFKNCKCYAQQCIKSNNINGCCMKCIYQSKKGCTTSNLSCKLYYCLEVTKRYNTPNYSDLKILKVLSFRSKPILIHNYFSNREDILSDLYYNSIVLFTLRIIYRNIKRILYIKNK